MTFTPDLVRELRHQQEATWTKHCPSQNPDVPCGQLMDDSARYCDHCEAEIEHDSSIGLHRATLREKISGADVAVTGALRALTELTRLYDADLAGDIDGDDMRHELEAAALHLRNAIRIDRAHRADCTPPAEPTDV